MLPGCVQTWASELVTSSKNAQIAQTRSQMKAMIIVYLSVPSKPAGNGVRQGAGCVNSSVTSFDWTRRPSRTPSGGGMS